MNNLQQLLVLTSPPASGKTYWIASLKEALGDIEILVISPLRALADECREKWGSRIHVMTPEEWLGKRLYADVVIFDEFHLFFYWGDSFRPLMWEMFFEISLHTKLSILLTATLSPAMIDEIKNFSSQFDTLEWIDRGNQILKFKPRKYIKANSRRWIMDQIFHQKKNHKPKLIFCKFRNEVFDLEAKLVKDGFSCLTCVGGESKFMAGKLSQMPSPDYIVCTTVLSHGVNLPKIEKLYFTYKVENPDFWIQMVARGGRKGEEFQVFALEKPIGLEWGVWRNSFQLFILDIELKVSSFFSFKSFDFF
jgi:ATP-dependent DNA helicase RecQ